MSIRRATIPLSLLVARFVNRWQALFAALVGCCRAEQGEEVGHRRSLDPTRLNPYLGRM